MEEAINSISTQVAVIKEKTMMDLMRRHNFSDYTTLQKNGYRIVSELHGNGEEYFILCKDVDTERIPKLVFASTHTQEKV